jgi:hypothetical protein
MVTHAIDEQQKREGRVRLMKGEREEARRGDRGEKK